MEEVVAEDARQGRDVATLQVVIEAASPLMLGQLGGLGAQTRQAHPEVAGPSCLSTAVVVQPPVLVA